MSDLEIIKSNINFLSSILSSQIIWIFYCSVLSIINIFLTIVCIWKIKS